MGEKEKFTNFEIAEQLKRILSTPAFNNSPVLSRFLEFIVDETVAGKEQGIKEYTIGIHVLARRNDFNPQLDAIVRTHAGRLRRALKEYYHDKGKNDQIWIEIPKGSYVPVFQLQNEIRQIETNEKIDLSRSKPVVAVLPFRNISRDASRDFFADGLGELLSTELTQFQDLSVISHYSSHHVAGKTNDIKNAAALLGANYILTGSIQNDDTHLRVQTQLIVGKTGEQLWAKSFERNNTTTGLFEIQNEIVKSILTAIGGYYGAIFKDILKAPYNNQSEDLHIYDAIFWYYHYQKVFSKEVYEKALNALEAAVKADPDFALAWAMLGELYLDDLAMEFKKVEDPKELGLKCAQRAIFIDPSCQHAYHALAWIYLFHRNKEECIKAVDHCLAINPNSADKVGAKGFVLVCAGEFERGFKMLIVSFENNPFCPFWFYVGFVFYFLNKKDYPQALHWSGKVNRPDLFWDPMLKACVLGHLDRTDEAHKNLELLSKLIPQIEQVNSITEAFILSDHLNTEILTGLRKAGLNNEHQMPAGTMER